MNGRPRLQKYSFKNDDDSLLGTSKHPQTIWSLDEMKALRTLYTDANLTMDEIASHLPGKTARQIRHKAWMMALGRYDNIMTAVNEINKSRLIK